MQSNLRNIVSLVSKVSELICYAIDLCKCAIGKKFGMLDTTYNEIIIY